MYLGTSAIHSFRLASLDFEVKLQLSNVAYTQLHGSNGISWALLNAIQVCQHAVYSHLRNYVLTYPRLSTLSTHFRFVTLSQRDFLFGIMNHNKTL